MNSACLINKAKLALNVLPPRFYGVFSQCTNKHLALLGNKDVKSLHQNLLCRNVKYISNCNSMQTKDSETTTNNDVKLQKVLDDSEFQNILQDFAKDFGVDDDSNKLLEDIRKDIDEGHPENDLKVKHPRQSNNVGLESKDRFLLKYKEFSEEDAAVIRSYEEQFDPLEENEKPYHIEQEYTTRKTYQDLKRGISGVFDIDELVEVLRYESLLDITAISIPKELHYADFLVIATAKSLRHSEAVCELILKLYKQKKSQKDPFVKIEGEKQSNWKAVDMGNIVLHIFLEETRALYDLESLWLFDSDFDSGGNMYTDPMMNILKEQMDFFKNLQQSDSEDSPKDNS